MGKCYLFHYHSNYLCILTKLQKIEWVDPKLLSQLGHFWLLTKIGECHFLTFPLQIHAIFHVISMHGREEKHGRTDGRTGLKTFAP